MLDESEGFPVHCVIFRYMLSIPCIEVSPEMESASDHSRVPDSDILGILSDIDGIPFVVLGGDIDDLVGTRLEEKDRAPLIVRTDGIDDRVPSGILEIHASAVPIVGNHASGDLAVIGLFDQDPLPVGVP